MPSSRKISANWGIDPNNPGYCLTTPVLVDKKPASQKVFLAHLNRNTLSNWRAQRALAGVELARKISASVLYAEASYLRYRSAVFRQSATNDWGRLLATRTDLPEYAEQTFLLAATLENKCKVENAIGICLIRRSWANNLFLDYLAKSPRLFSEPNVHGMAPGLVYTVLLMGLELKCRNLYLEPSRDALSFYEKLFDQKIEDLEKIPIEPALTRVQSAIEIMGSIK